MACGRRIAVGRRNAPSGRDFIGLICGCPVRMALPCSAGARFAGLTGRRSETLKQIYMTGLISFLKDVDDGKV